jgi:hypothetical protein
MSDELPPELETLKQELTDRFVRGIHKSFTPCPLIGPKWLQVFPQGRPAEFRFIGIRRLAKAIGFSPAKILQILMKNVSFEGLEVDVQIRQGVLIDINRAGKTPQYPAPSARPPVGAPNPPINDKKPKGPFGRFGRSKPRPESAGRGPK